MSRLHTGFARFEHRRADNNSHAHNANDKRDYLLLIAASGLISLWLILLDPILSDAAVYQLNSARSLSASQGDTIPATQLLGSFAIAGVHQLSGLSLVTTAHLLSSGLYVLVCLAFVTTVKGLGGTRRVQFLAACVVLLQPLLCELRSDLSFVPGYWAFALLALRQLLRYSHAPGWTTRLLWFACIAAASLFRLEALVLANLAPLMLLLALPRRRRQAAFFELLLPMWIVTSILYFSGVLAAIALIQGSPLPAGLAGLSELASPAGLLPAAALDALPQLAHSADRDWAVAGGLLGLLAATFARALGPVSLLLLLLGWWRGSLFTLAGPGSSLINAHLGVNLLFLAACAMLGASVMPQDSALAALLLSLYLPFVLDELWQRGALAGKLAVLAAVVTLAASSLYNTRYEQDYLAEAGQWISRDIPAQASVISNRPYLAYLVADRTSGGLPDSPRIAAAVTDFLAADDWREFQYVALHLSPAEYDQWQQLVDYPQLEVLRVFAGRHRDMVLVLENTAALPPG